MMSKIASLRSSLGSGVTPAMATPLQSDGVRVNTAVVAQLVDFLVNAGVDGLFVGGTTGEGILLDVAERKRLHAAAAAAADGRIPILAHVGANRLDTAVALAKHAVQTGADAVVAITPTFYKLDEDSLAAYFQAISSAVPDTPLLLYDIPHMAINGITPSLLVRLGETLPALAGVKTSRPDAQIVRQLIDAAPEGVLILVGNERIALGTLALGADGLISGLSTAVPEPFVSLTRAFAAGDLAEARRWQQTINRLLDAMPPQRIGGIKTILTERGIPLGPAVPPRPMPTRAVWPDLKAVLR